MCEVKDYYSKKAVKEFIESMMLLM